MIKFFSILLVIIILLILAAAGVFLYFEWQLHKPLSNDQTIKTFTVEEGQGVKDISVALEEGSLIRDDWYFKVYVRLKGKEADFQAGDFEISSAMNIPEIVEVLTGEPESREIDITIIDGWDRRDIDQYLVEVGLIREGEFIAATREFESSIFARQYDLSRTASLEGFLFPDTYRIYKDATIDDILKKMFQNFQNKVDPLIPEIEAQEKDLYEILIMASIVERESASRDEMALIAGVFYNRLESDYLLESDATVNFVTGKKLRRPTLEDTRTDSRYNTYIYRGLPPGPICNPGLAAIKAAINPEETDYFYFIHPKDGGTIFSKTLDEHNQNKAEYLNNED